MAALFSRPATFVASAATPAQAAALATSLPEICFLGRSNCGKSSLINAVLNRRHLVKTAKRPGHTRLLNFFTIADHLTLVDMPGYGFGSRAEWGDLIGGYWRHRPQYVLTAHGLRLACLLVDSRRGLMEVDEQAAALLEEAGVPYQLVLTKADKLSAAQQAAREAEVATQAARLGWRQCRPPVVSVSSHSKLGLDRLRGLLAAAAA